MSSEKQNTVFSSFYDSWEKGNFLPSRRCQSSYITRHWPKVDRIEAKNSGKARCLIRPSQRYGHLQLMNNAVLQKAFRSKNNCVSQLEKQFCRNVVAKSIIRSWWRTNNLPIQFNHEGEANQWPSAFWVAFSNNGLCRLAGVEFFHWWLGETRKNSECSEQESNLRLISRLLVWMLCLWAIGTLGGTAIKTRNGVHISFDFPVVRQSSPPRFWLPPVGCVFLTMLLF